MKGSRIVAELTERSITSGNFVFTPTSIEGVMAVDVKTYGDRRGYFMETYRRDNFVAAGIDAEFVQDNQSSSSQGVLRGLHFQIAHPQAKLVRVIRGTVLTWQLICARGALPGVSGKASFFPRRIIVNSLCREVLPTDFWCSRMKLSSATNATIPTIRAMRVALCGTIPR